MKCEEKHRFGSKAHAKLTAKKVHKKGSPKSWPYRCQTCGFWHLTHADARDRAFFRSQRRRP